VGLVAIGATICFLCDASIFCTWLLQDSRLRARAASP